MSLKNFQTQINLDTIYYTSISHKMAGDQLGPNLFIDVGSVDIYVYNGEDVPAALADMTLYKTNASGLVKMENIPTYMLLVQNAGTSTEIIVSGLEVRLIVEV